MTKDLLAPVISKLEIFELKFNSLASSHNYFSGHDTVASGRGGSCQASGGSAHVPQASSTLDHRVNSTQAPVGVSHPSNIDTNQIPEGVAIVPQVVHQEGQVSQAAHREGQETANEDPPSIHTPSHHKMVRTGNKCTLDLPPQSAPLVAVLLGVPLLTLGSEETSMDLVHKTTHWCDNNVINSSNISPDIMARRVGWIGQGTRKNVEGDCIIINFRHSAKAKELVGCQYKNGNKTKIRTVSLQSFYPFKHPLANREWQLPFKLVKSSQDRNVNPTPILTNRFLPLANHQGLDAND